MCVLAILSSPKLLEDFVQNCGHSWLEVELHNVARHFWVLLCKEYGQERTCKHHAKVFDAIMQRFVTPDEYFHALNIEMSWSMQECRIG
jgi:hypothetical protein